MTDLGFIYSFPTDWATTIFVEKKDIQCGNCLSMLKIKGIATPGAPELQIIYCPVCNQRIELSTVRILGWGKMWSYDSLVSRGPDPIPPPTPVPISPPEVPVKVEERYMEVTCEACKSLIGVEGRKDPHAEDIQEHRCPQCLAPIFLKRGFIRTTWDRLTTIRSGPPAPVPVPTWAKTALIVGGVALVAVIVLKKAID